MILLQENWLNTFEEHTDAQVPGFIEEMKTNKFFILLNPKMILCRFSPYQCDDFTLYRSINSINFKRRIIKYSSYLLLGNKRRNYLSWKFWSDRESFKPYYEPSYGIYLFLSLIALLDCIFYKKYIKKVLLLFLLFLSFFSFVVVWVSPVFQYLVYAETLGLIPLAAYGAYIFINIVSENKVLRRLLFGIMIFLFMLPFIKQGWYTQMRQYAYFNLLPISLINLILTAFVIICFYFIIKDNKTSRYKSVKKNDL